jgi:hypothetical protein
LAGTRHQEIKIHAGLRDLRKLAFRDMSTPMTWNFEGTGAREKVTPNTMTNIKRGVFADARELESAEIDPMDSKLIRISTQTLANTKIWELSCPASFANTKIWDIASRERPLEVPDIRSIINLLWADPNPDKRVYYTRVREAHHSHLGEMLPKSFYMIRTPWTKWTSISLFARTLRGDGVRCAGLLREIRIALSFLISPGNPSHYTTSMS